MQVSTHRIAVVGGDARDVLHRGDDVPLVISDVGRTGWTRAKSTTVLASDCASFGWPKASVLLRLRLFDGVAGILNVDVPICFELACFGCFEANWSVGENYVVW